MKRSTEKVDNVGCVFDAWVSEGCPCRVQICYKSDSLELLFGRVILGRNKFKPENKFISKSISIEEFDVFISLDSINSISDILNNQSNVFVCSEILRNTTQSKIRHRSDFISGHPDFKGPERWPGAMFILDGDVDFPKPEIVELHATTSDPAYFNLSDLLESFGIPTSILENRTNRRIDIVLIPPVSISDIENKNDEISVSISKNNNYYNGDVRLSIIQHFSHKEPFRKTQQLRINSIPEDFPVDEIKYPADDALVNQFILSCSGELAARKSIVNPNIKRRMESFIINEFDNRGVFDRDFFTNKNQFEERVSLLFSIRGFRNLHLGSVIPNGPDIIVISDDGYVFIIECKSEEIKNEDHIKNLTQRTDMVRNSIDEMRFSYINLLPVIISAKERMYNKKYIDIANKMGVSVVCREDLDEFLIKKELDITGFGLYQSLVSQIQS